MRNRIGSLLGIALALAIAADLASAASWSRWNKKAPPARPQMETFSDSGEFLGGALEGTMSLNGQSYWVSPDVKIFEIGRGLILIPAGTELGLRRLSVSGVVREGVSVVQMIIVRPGLYDQPLSGSQGPTEASEERPR